MPEITLPESAPIKPFEGPPATPDTFLTAFPEMERMIKGGRGINPLDRVTQANLDELRRNVRSNPFKPATIINLHPWPLQFSMSTPFVRGIVVPACNPGDEFAHLHVRSWSHDQSYNEDGTMKFTAIKPIQKAAQFLISFADPEMYGGGVIIYEGEGHPNKVGEVETYRPDGRPEVTVKIGYEYDDENHPYKVEQEVPIRRKLAEMIAEQRRVRNERYMVRVQAADDNFKSGDAAKRKLITAMDRQMAEMLVAEGVLSRAPEWNLSSRMDEGLSENHCPSCGGIPDANAFRCQRCAHVLNPLEAYKHASIEYGHASFDLLTAEEWAVVEEIKSDRDKARADAAAHRAKTAKKAKE